MNFNEFSESTTVVVPDSFGIPKGLQQWICCLKTKCAWTEIQFLTPTIDTLLFREFHDKNSHYEFWYWDNNNFVKKLTLKYPLLELVDVSAPGLGQILQDILGGLGFSGPGFSRHDDGLTHLVDLHVTERLVS